MLEKFKPSFPSSFNELSTLQDEINKIFSRFFSSKDFAVASFTPKLDLSETDNEFKIAVDVPGFTENDIEVSFENGVLTIKGKKEDEKVEEKENFYHKERFSGSFMRNISIPKPIKVDGIKATFKNGVLNVYLPKEEEVKPKSIKINIE
ncbi:MAG: Hsp20/alpha crystallin family protein [Calditerrivibrio sp.]|nr:Hsp20/alpha crystallin family protein [Calditerrivibrio sp.]MCA1932534.1 Hsp20/alpha crystallin family protein [Calditerrivibrio sp.]MCA1980369.1 Hsp20/alpha crystallin family protein [Calditerrivibrio sp.]